MPDNAPKKGPRVAGGGAGRTKKVSTPTVAPHTGGGKIQPPRDPVLRAIWRVCSEDLSNQERLGLLILWRLLGEDKKPLGASLFSKLLNTSYARAKNILTKLQQLGYITSDGQFSAGLSKRASRAMTKKAKLPTGKTRHRTVTGRGHPNPAPLGASDPAPLGASDLGVGHTVGVVSDDTPTAETTDDRTHAGRTVRIVDILAAGSDRDLVKSGGGAA